MPCFAMLNWIECARMDPTAVEPSEALAFGHEGKMGYGALVSPKPILHSSPPIGHVVQPRPREQRQRPCPFCSLLCTHISPLSGACRLGWRKQQRLGQGFQSKRAVRGALALGTQRQWLSSPDGVQGCQWSASHRTWWSRHIPRAHMRVVTWERKRHTGAHWGAPRS